MQAEARRPPSASTADQNMFSLHGSMGGPAWLQHSHYENIYYGATKSIKELK